MPVIGPNERRMIVSPPENSQEGSRVSAVRACAFCRHRADFFLPLRTIRKPEHNRFLPELRPGGSAPGASVLCPSAWLLSYSLLRRTSSVNMHNKHGVISLFVVYVLYYLAFLLFISHNLRDLFLCLLTNVKKLTVSEILTGILHNRNKKSPHGTGLSRAGKRSLFYFVMVRCG